MFLKTPPLFNHSFMSNSETPWTAACQAFLSSTISWSLLKLMFSQWSIQPSCALSSPTPASIFPRIMDFSKWSALCLRWTKYWSFYFSSSPSNEYSGFISFRIYWFDIFVVQGTLKSLLQQHSWKHQFISTQPSLWSNSHIHTLPLEKP